MNVYLQYFRSTPGLVAKPYPVEQLACDIVDGFRQDPGNLKPPSQAQMKWRGLKTGALRMCTRCGDVHPANEAHFYREVRTRSGLTAECKTCIRNRRNERYYRNSAQRASTYKRVRRA